MKILREVQSHNDTKAQRYELRCKDRDWNLKFHLEIVTDNLQKVFQTVFLRPNYKIFEPVTLVWLQLKSLNASCLQLS